MTRFGGHLAFIGCLFVGYGIARSCEMQARPKTVRPHQLGWLRRSELEPHKGVQAWEMPTGELYWHHGEKEPVLQVMPRERA